MMFHKEPERAIRESSMVTMTTRPTQIGTSIAGKATKMLKKIRVSN